MQFSTGIFDSLFGKKIKIRWKNTYRVVTRKWLEQMEQEGHIQKNLKVTLHILTLKGYERHTCNIGEDIDQETYQKYADPNTGDLHAVDLFEAGAIVRHWVNKDAFVDLKRDYGLLANVFAYRKSIAK